MILRSGMVSGAHPVRAGEHAGGLRAARRAGCRRVHRRQDPADRRPAGRCLAAGARHRHLPGMMHTMLPPAAGVLGLLAPDWLVGQAAQALPGAAGARPAGRAGHDGDLRPGGARPGAGDHPGRRRTAERLSRDRHGIRADRQRAAGHVGQPHRASPTSASAPGSRRSSGWRRRWCRPSTTARRCPRRCACCRPRCGRRR